jgi:hypothetical protein
LYFYFQKKLKFEVATDIIDEKVIGSFVFEKKSIDVQKILKSAIPEMIDVNISTFEILVLPNDHLLSANYYEKNLTLYDENFNLLKTIETINNEKISPLGIAINEKSQLYIPNFDRHQIFMTDIEFNKIKSVGTLGNDNTQFKHPYGICYKNSNLYVCDYGNKRIQILTEDLEYEKSFHVNYAPWTIKASDSLLCVESANPEGIFFYSINDLSVQHTYNHGYCRISEINSNFYEFSRTTKTVYCYDENGGLIEEIKLNGIDDFIKHSWDGTFLNFKENIFMTCSSSKKMIKF